jgi:hypothetical protein
MLFVLIGLIAFVLAIIVLGEWSDARFQRRHGAMGRVTHPVGAQLPEPLVPSTIQRSSGNG